MAIPKRTCYVCKARGKWTTYVIWDRDDPTIGGNGPRHRNWICFDCSNKQDREEV